MNCVVELKLLNNRLDVMQAIWDMWLIILFQIEKERGKKDEQLLQKTEKLREVTKKLEKTKNEYESSAGVFLMLKTTEIKRLESEHQKRLDKVTIG